VSPKPVIKFRITGFLQFVNRLELLIIEMTTFRKLNLIPSSDEGRETHILLGPLEKSDLNHWTWRLALSSDPTE
jgi:hypothetical protein